MACQNASTATPAATFGRRCGGYLAGTRCLQVRRSIANRSRPNMRSNSRIVPERGGKSGGSSDSGGAGDASPPPLLPLLEQCCSMRELYQIHAQLLKSDAVGNPLFTAELLSFCASSDVGDTHYAVRLLFSLPCRNSILCNSLIQGLCAGSAPEQSVLLFVRLAEEDPALLNAHSFPSVVKACAKINGLFEGTQIHGFAIKCGAAVDSYVQNSLLKMYFGCGRPRDGQLLFDRMPERNVVAWNCIIGGYAELGLWEDVKSLFRMMVREFRVVPSSIILGRVVTACTRSADFDMGKHVHHYVEENGVSLCLNLGNALMNMYAKFGEMEEAHRLFLQMPDRDVVSWTTLVSGYASIGCLIPARELFDKMPARNTVAWNAMIAGYVSNGCFKEAILLYNEMLALNVKTDKATKLSVLSACARAGDLLIGKVIHGFIYKARINMTLDLCNSILSLYSMCSNMDSAELLFKRMGAKNEISWTIMMMGYVKCGAKEAALKIFKRMPNKDVAAWNGLISALSQCNHFVEALDVFDKMQRMKVRPNCLTLVSTLSSCAKAGALELGKWIHAYIDRNNMEMDAYLSSSLVDMYAKCGCIELSLEVFNGIPRKDLLAWSTMIGGLAMHGYSKLALELFRQMADCGVQPDAITFVGVLTACSHAGLVEEGLHYFEMMTQIYGITPTTEHYGCMVDLFGRRGFLKNAKDFINSVSISSNKEAIWGALLSACKLHGNVELAEYAASRLTDADPSNSGAFVLLSNVYAKASKWNDVGKVRSRMRERGIAKIPGCSSIEVNGIIHEFFVGDASHPQSREIYMTLNGLGKILETTWQCDIMDT